MKHPYGKTGIDYEGYLEHEHITPSKALYDGIPQMLLLHPPISVRH